MLRRWVFWLLAGLFVWVVISRFNEIQRLVQILTSGQTQWVLAAVLLTIIYTLIRTILYQAAFYSVEVDSRFWALLPVMLASLFVNTVVPSSGAGGAALFADDAARRGEPAAKAAAGALLAMVVDYSAFVLVLVAGFTYLRVQQRLQVYQAIGAALLLLIILSLTALFLFGLWLPDRLRRLLYWIQGTANHLGGLINRPALLADGWAEKNATELQQATVALTSHPFRLGFMVVVALAAHLVNLAILATLFLAFRQPAVFGRLVAGYATGMLFWIVAITPQGIGAVEAAMTAAYTSLGVPLETAAVIALAFRGLIFWLPAAIGFALLRSIQTFRGK